MQVNAYLHPTQQRTNPKTGGVGVVSTHVYEQYRRKVYTTSQQNQPYMCESITSLSRIFPKYSKNFLSLEIFQQSFIQSRSDMFSYLLIYVPPSSIITHNFLCHNTQFFYILASMVFFMVDPLTDIHAIKILKSTYFLWPQPVTKGLFLCDDSNISAVLHKVIKLTIEPALLYLYYVCIDNCLPLRKK